MKLNFTLNEKDCLNFSERYFKRSPSHQKVKRRTQLMFPLIMMAFCLFFTVSSSGIDFTRGLLYLGLAAIWYIFYPKRFDANIRKHALKQMKESSYSNTFGDYELTLQDDCLQSQSPTGNTTYNWSSIDDVEISGGYLYIFLSGPQGYPIRLEEIGSEAAQQALKFIKPHLN